MNESDEINDVINFFLCFVNSTIASRKQNVCNKNEKQKKI